MEHDDVLAITTPEGVEVELALAGLGSRFIAATLDLLVRAAVAALALVAAFAVLDGGVLILVTSVGGFLLLFAYDVAFEALAGGRTPGKRWTGLRVLRETGAPVSAVASAIRNVLRLVDFLPALYGIGMAAVFLTARNQRLGDLAAGTIVVRERLGGRPLATDTAPAPLTTAAGWDTSAVTAEDLATVRAFLERRPGLTAGARAQLATTLADRLRPKVAGAPPLEPEDFLTRLAAARDR